MNTLRTFAVLPLVLLGVSAPTMAGADEAPLVPVATDQFVLPGNGSEVPIDTLVWSTLEEPLELAVDGGGGSPLIDRVRLETVAGTLIVGAGPDGFLQAATGYELRRVSGDVVAGFRTSAGDPAEAPEVPIVGAADSEVLQDGSVRLRLTMAGTPLGIHLVALQAEDALQDAVLLGASAEYTLVAYVDDPRVDPDGTVVVGTLGLDGTFSGWSEPIRLDSSAPGCAASVVGRSTSSAAALLLGAGLGLGLRRRAGFGVGCPS